MVAANVTFDLMAFATDLNFLANQVTKWFLKLT